MGLLAFDDVDILATALKQEALTGKLLQKLGRVLQILDKGAIARNLCLKLGNLNLDIGMAPLGLDNVVDGAHRDNNGEDGNSHAQRYPKVFYNARSKVHGALRNMHKLMRLNRYIPLGVLLDPLDKRRYDALVDAPLGL